MKRASVVLIAATMTVAGLSLSVQAYMGASGPSQCPPGDQFVTVMAPCVKSEWVAETQPCMTPVPVKRVCYKDQKILVKATPVGPACGKDPCVRCCPKPMCKVVTQKVPMVYYEQQLVPSYNIKYRKVCKKVMVPYTYKVQAFPLCR
jgi:hypothetical protein